MKIHYVSCFPPHDQTELPLRTVLQDWESRTYIEFTNAMTQDAESCREHMNSLTGKAFDVVIIGGHGHTGDSGRS
jgi:hypothetical protein